MVQTDLVALIGGCASAVAVLSTSMRTRQDLDVDEIKKRTEDLTTRLSASEKEIGELRSQLVQCEENNFALRRLLAANGIKAAPDLDVGGGSHA